MFGSLQLIGGLLVVRGEALMHSKLFALPAEVAKRWAFTFAAASFVLLATVRIIRFIRSKPKPFQ